MTRRLALLPALLLAAPALAAKHAARALPSDDARAIYSVGYSIGRTLEPLALAPGELKYVEAGLRDAATGKPAAVDLEAYGPRVRALVEKRGLEVAGKEKAKGKAFLAAFSKKPGARPVSGGAWIRRDKEGTGARPGPDDTVKVNYRGTHIDGTEFDSSYKRHEPAVFPLKGVIPCWTHGVATMRVGEQATLVCPSSTAYGDRGSPPVIKGGETLVFEIELLDVVKTPAGK